MTKLLESCGQIVERGRPLGPLTTFGIGGPAEYFVTPRDEAELRAAIRCCTEDAIPIHVLGNGSNVLVPDEGISGAIIQLDPKGFSGVTVDENRLLAGASTRLPVLMGHAARAGLSGLEPLAGIPGWVGGAMKMNAGGAQGDIGEVTERVKVMDMQGRVLDRRHDELAFRYRGSDLRDQLVIEAEFRLAVVDEHHVRSRMREILTARKASQPMNLRSAGCVFKNPPGTMAGLLIDEAGLKDARIGGAEVSSKHANFIVAGPGATAKDVQHLIDLVRDKVRERTGLLLELELEIW
jgi:UDP-N-acetylmuramate dehydrogenase